jgi:hypothetical protein
MMALLHMVMLLTVLLEVLRWCSGGGHVVEEGIEPRDPLVHMIILPLTSSPTTVSLTLLFMKPGTSPARGKPTMPLSSMVAKAI